MIKIKEINNTIQIQNTNKMATSEKEMLEKALMNREEIYERSLKNIDFSSPILLQSEGMGVIFPNTINVIQGKKGVHKSRLTETFCACFLDKNKSHNHIGFRSILEGDFKLIYVDTERNHKDQFPYAMQQIRKKAGYPYNINPQNFDFFSLINIPRADRFLCLKNYIGLKQEEYPNNHFIIILDVVTDCIENFNDPKESLKLIDLMNELVNEKDVTFICIIHENPGGEKARGHLGTEIINKASQVMQISFDGESKELILVKFLNSRNTKPLEPLSLTYDDATKGLILADIDCINRNQVSKQKAAPIYLVKSWLEKYVPKMEVISKKELLVGFMNQFGCSERIVEERIKALVDEGFLIKTKNGRNAMYKLNK